MLSLEAWIVFPQHLQNLWVLLALKREALLGQSCGLDQMFLHVQGFAGVLVSHSIYP